MTLKELAIDHPYFCNDNNYYSNKAAENYSCWEDFYDDWSGADIDMNLIFRFDIIQDEETNLYSMKIFFILQRKGIFKPVSIKSVREDNVEEIIKLLTKHHKRLKEIWLPFK